MNTRPQHNREKCQQKAHNNKNKRPSLITPQLMTETASPHNIYIPRQTSREQKRQAQLNQDNHKQQHIKEHNNYQLMPIFIN